MKKCIFCNENVNATEIPMKKDYSYECNICGNYLITHEVLEDEIKSDEIKKKYSNKNLFIVACVLNEMKRLGKNEALVLNNDNIDNTINNILKSPLIPHKIMQKLEKLIINIYNDIDFGINKKFEYNNYKFVSYSYLDKEVKALMKVLKVKNYINWDDEYISITFEGIQWAEQLKEKTTVSNSVFVAMGFNEDLLNAHVNAIKPACEECGFEAYLVSEKEFNDGITDKIIAEIKASKFVIVDLTYNNCGAYFEAGYAQGRGLEVIRTCKNEWFKNKDNKLHFDVTHYNFILWDDENDLKEKLINRIRATII